MKQRRRFGPVVFVLAVAVVFACFFGALSNLESDQQMEGKAQLEEVLRRTAAACYAAEGAYPPDIDYLVEHYGLTYDSAEYFIDYQYIGANLRPDVTIIKKDGDIWSD